MRSLSTALFVLLTLGVVLGGCSSDTGPNDGGPSDGHSLDGCQGAGEKLLSVVGNPEHVMRPGESVELKVFLLEKCVGAVAGERVDFQITSNPGDSSLSSGSVTTQANGLAAVTFNAGQTPGQFQVHASCASDPEGVYFHIQLKAVMHSLSAVGATELRCYTGSSLELTVKVQDVTNPASPIAVQGATIQFAIDSGPPGYDATIPSPTAISSASGLASSTFVAGSITGTHVVRVEEPGRPSRVEYRIQVDPRQGCTDSSQCDPGFVCINGTCVESSGEDCTNDDQCPEGYFCDGGYCRPEGSLPDSCNDHPDCPPGYYCEQHRCYPCPDCCPDDCTDPPCPPACTSGDNGCETDEDCPPGFECKNGFCVPKTGDTVVIPELGGTWYTEHYFNIGEALPGFSGTVQNVVGILDRAINHCEITGWGFVDDFLCDIIHEYVPDWVGTLINIFYNLSEMLRELRTEGVMVLSHSNPRAVINGTEDWNKIMIRYPEACCADHDPRCNYQAQPGWPECSYIDITRQELDWADVGMRVHAFTGEVEVDDSGAQTVYTLRFDDRVAEIQFKKFVGFLVELLVEIFLGYDSLEAALQDLVDCQALQDLIERTFGSWVPDLTGACEDMLPSADDLILGLLNQISVDWSILNFGGWATITTQGGNPPYGVQLGDSMHESTGDGHWDGDFTVIVNGDVTGSWFGER
ncbi:MAG: hypothetical protein JXR96_09460 [Deltaproteobacteria bacterium]|nr:hypothetical protein [Deltaproteobacteria bacterium]